MNNRKKLGVLMGLFALWAVLTVVQWADFSGPSPESPVSHKGGATLSGQATLPPTKSLILDKDFPNVRKTVKLSNPRNIFAPLGSSTQLADKTVQAPILSSQAKAAAAPSSAPPPGPSPAELAAQRARQELNQFRFLGFLTRGGESQAFLTNGQSIYIVKQGEILEGRVQVNKIEPETVILSTKIWETGNTVQASIPLTPDTHG